MRGFLALFLVLALLGSAHAAEPDDSCDYPAAIDLLTAVTAGATITAADQNKLRGCVNQLMRALGANPAGPGSAASVAGRIDGADGVRDIPKLTTVNEFELAARQVMPYLNSEIWVTPKWSGGSHAGRVNAAITACDALVGAGKR